MSKMKELARRSVQSGRNLAAASGALLMLGVTQVHAALPGPAAAAFSQLEASVTDVMTAVWLIVGAVVGGFALVTLFKKGAAKAV